MPYLSFPADSCPQYISCGQLVKQEHFLHQRRNLDCFVLIYVTKGCLFIHQNDCDYQVQKHQFLVLQAFTEHFGYQKSEGELQYFWVHFYLPKNYSSSTHKPPHTEQLCILPEYGSLPEKRRFPLLFNQLLDMAKNSFSSSSWLLQHMLSVLLLELTEEYFYSETEQQKLPEHIYRIQNWISDNYQRHLSVGEIAALFHYNPDYLSNDFKKHSGVSLTQYINSLRIKTAKDLLITDDMSMRELAFYCGFSDDKYFFRVFRQMTGMSPLTYKQTFYKKQRVTS